MIKKIVIAVIIILLVIVTATWLSSKNETVYPQMVSTEEPLNVVLDFYDPWLSALKSTSTDPYKLKLDKDPILSRELSKRISDMKKHSADEPDPVLCQIGVVPTSISGRIIYETGEKAGVLILGRDQGLTNQAIVSLLRLNDGWYIDNIECSPGEFAPPQEFSFMREGFLLKSVPKPFDSKYWHIVFEENKELGHVAPLFFNDESTCVSTTGESSKCDPSKFTEAVKIMVYGEMMESGVVVSKIEFIKE